MEETKLVYTPKIESEALGYEIYQRKFGVLAKKSDLIMALFGAVIIMLITILSNLKNQDIDGFFIGFSIFFDVILEIIFVCIMKNVREKFVKGLSRSVFKYGFNKRLKKEICLNSEFLTVNTPYSKMCYPLNEINKVISTKEFFIISTNETEMVFTVIKKGQNPEVLFKMDNIFTEKLGQNFIYEMEKNI